MSVIGDQPANAKEAERIGFGIRLPFSQVSVEKLKSAVNDVLNNPKYSQVAKTHGSAVMDQKEHPLDRAIWWLEHTMRHPTIYRGRNPIHKLNSIQLNQLDVITFLVTIVLAMIYLLFKIIACCCCRGRGQRAASTSSKTKSDWAYAANLQPSRPKTNVTLLFYFLKLYNFCFNQNSVGSTSVELQPS